jgi:lipoprotein-releasing system permease protein
MVNLSFDIAKRYLFGKKSTNSINVITGISVFGISIGTAALILILSVFNGFESLLSGLFNAFNPDLKVIAYEGKYFEIDSSTLAHIKNIEGIKLVSASLEEVALFEYKGAQEIGSIKGVDQFYGQATGLDSMIIDGDYVLAKSNISFGLLGTGMRNKLSLNVNDKLNPVSVYMPLKKKQLFGAKEYKVQDLYPAGVFSVKSDNDFQYILTNLEFVQSLLGNPNMLSALEIKLVSPAFEPAVRVALKNILDQNLIINNRYQQDEAFLKVMEIEKWISFLITCFTMVLIAFNLLGALWMIVLDKQKDISVLKAMGYDRLSVRNIFLKLGLLISVIGIVIGFVLALVFFFVQKQYGIIGVPEGFLIDSYPIKLKLTDFFLVSVTVLAISLLASLLPALKASRSLVVLRGQ